MTFISWVSGRGSPKKAGNRHICLGACVFDSYVLASQIPTKAPSGLPIPSVSESPLFRKNQSVLLFTAMASIAAPGGGQEYGRRLIPTLVDEMAAFTPDHVYASIPRHQDFTGGFENVTSRKLARAVNRAAFWIDEKIGKSAKFETIAYLGPSKADMLGKDVAKFHHQWTSDTTSLRSPLRKWATR